MIKRLIIFVLAIAGILYFALKDDAKAPEIATETGQETQAPAEGEEGTEETVVSEGGEQSEVDDKQTEDKVMEEKKPESTPVKEPAMKTLDFENNTEVKTTTPVVEQTVTTEETVTVVEMPKKQEPVNGPTTNVKVYLYEWEIDSSELTVPAGTVNFEVVNTGSFSHNFGISGVTDFGRVNPGETKSFTAQLTSGEFELMSSKKVDMERGMQEAFTVR